MQTTRPEAALNLDSVSVSFPIYHGTSRSLKKNLLFRSTGGRIGRDANQRVTIEALHNISLSLVERDRLALIGSNGAGKTTLLRVMGGVYEPTSGSLSIRGKVSSMIDIGIGIDPELNGYENIRLRGLLLEMAPDEIEDRVSDIAEFTELGDYLHMPVRTYSVGMMMRLTFAVSTCFTPDIVLMDEWILAGDIHFMAKAHSRIEQFIDRSSILVLASHNLELLRRWCSKAAWLQHGRLRSFGAIDDVIEAYLKDAS